MNVNGFLIKISSLIQIPGIPDYNGVFEHLKTVL